MRQTCAKQRAEMCQISVAKCAKHVPSSVPKCARHVVSTAPKYANNVVNMWPKASKTCQQQAGAAGSKFFDSQSKVHDWRRYPARRTRPLPPRTRRRTTNNAQSHRREKHVQARCPDVSPRHMPPFPVGKDVRITMPIKRLEDTGGIAEGLD